MPIITKKEYEQFLRTGDKIQSFIECEFNSRGEHQNEVLSINPIQRDCNKNIRISYFDRKQKATFEEFFDIRLAYMTQKEIDKDTLERKLEMLREDSNFLQKKISSVEEGLKELDKQQ